jgi:hypothetical protein
MEAGWKGAIQRLRSFSANRSTQNIDRALCGPGDFWLFVLGVNNSGTTVLTKLLETHPAIRALPSEGQLLTDAFPRPDRLGVERLWSARMDLFRWTESHDGAPALQAKKDWLEHYPNRPGVLLEKSPPNTLRSLWLQKHFSPSRFLAIVRHPYAVCEGIRRRRNYSIEQAAQHWFTANTCLLEDMEFLLRSLLIRYEDLVSNPERCLNQVQDFLGIARYSLQDACENVEAHSLEGNTYGLINLNDKSFSKLSAGDLATINRICGSLMSRFGYEQH